MADKSGRTEYERFENKEKIYSSCRKHGLNYEDMKHWYDGYSFDEGGSVYNSNSVMEAIVMQDYDTYWANTETYESLKSYIEEDFDGIQSALRNMMSGQDVFVNIWKFQNDMSLLKRRSNRYEAACEKKTEKAIKLEKDALALLPEINEDNALLTANLHANLGGFYRQSRQYDLTCQYMEMGMWILEQYGFTCTHDSTSIMPSFYVK